MKPLISIMALALGAATVAAQAGQRTESRTEGTVLDMPAKQGADSADHLPRQMMTKPQVRERYGEPEARHGPVGDPPISRWDYAGFSVYFEHDLVLHSVRPGDFPPIHHREQLTSQE